MVTKKTFSQNTYDVLSTIYRKVSSEKKNYLDGVDELIIKSAGKRKSLLDLGPGDGERINKMAKRLGVEKFILVENSSEMAKLSSKLVGSNKVVQRSITEYRPSNKFEIITCLWNVLGHVEPYSSIQGIFLNINSMLADNGLFFLDVNNRYNASAYGNWNALRNFLQDTFGFTNKKYFKFSKRINNLNVPMKVHFFSDLEISTFAKRAGLKIVESKYIDYNSGAIKKFPWQGQLFYIIEKAW